MNKIIKFLIRNKIDFKENINLSKYTWIKTGGTVNLWIEPNSTDELLGLLDLFHQYSVDYDIVGHTSNIFYLDTSIKNIIVSTKRLKNYIKSDNEVVCDCGAPIASLSKSLVDKGYLGFYGFVNLPGTIGAAAVNNSGCFGCTISDLVISLIIYNKKTGKLEEISNEKLKYSHRSSVIKRKELDAVIIKVALRLVKGSIKEEQQKALDATAERKRTQEPPAFTLGSVYANLQERKTIGFRLFCKLYILLAKTHLVKFPTKTHLLLTYYNYRDIEPYVSQKNVNTFIWDPNIVDKQSTFRRYCDFMEKAFFNPTLEIEIR